VVELSDVSSSRLLSALGPQPTKEAPLLGRVTRNEPTPSAHPSQPVFVAESGDSADLLGVGEALRPTAELCASAATQTPFAVGVVGAAGAGKSFALRRLEQAIAAASQRGGAGTLARVVVAKVDARAADGDLSVALAASAYEALEAGPEGGPYAALAQDAAHAGGDPRRAAAAAAERHEEISRRLEAERATRDEAEAKRARLTESLLYDTPGSRIDALVRSSRGRIESNLRPFGLAEGDAAMNFRDCVRDLAGAGHGRRAGLGFRAVLGYRSQGRLLLLALFFFLLAAGLNLLRSDSALAGLRSLGAALQPVADLIAAHAEIVERTIEALILLGFAAALLNLWRAAKFTLLLYRGLRLLNLDARERKRELDARVTRLNARVATLSGEADAAAKRAETAVKRAGGSAGAARTPGPDFVDARIDAKAAARAFLSELSRRIEAPQEGAPAAPQRIVLLVDNLDALGPDPALRALDDAIGALGPGFVSVVAFDPSALSSAAGGPSALRDRLNRAFGLCLSLGGLSRVDTEHLVARLLGGALPLSPPSMANDAIPVALAQPLEPSEQTLLTALAPLAARTPREAKRFLNLYRLLRAEPLPRPALALAAAAATSPDGDALRQLRDTLRGAARTLAEPPNSALAAAVRAARGAQGGDIDAESARAALAAAERHAWPV